MEVARGQHVGVGNTRGQVRFLGYRVVAVTIDGRKVRRWGVPFGDERECSRRVRQRERDERNRALREARRKPILVHQVE